MSAHTLDRLRMALSERAKPVWRQFSL